MNVVALALVIALVLFSLMTWRVVSMRDVERTANPWRMAAGRLGLQCEKVRSWPVFDWRIRGVRDGLAITVEKSQDGRGIATVVTVDGQGRIPRGFVLACEGGWRSFKKVFEGPDLLTGDAAFDAEVYVQGDEREALAVLTEPARRAAARWLVTSFDARVEGGRVECREQGVIGENRHLVALVEQTVEVAQHLVLETSSLAKQLRANALTDPNAAVRLRNLEVLTKRYAGKKVALQAARSALRSPDARARRLALNQLGAESEAALSTVAERDPDPETRAAALLRLGSFAGERMWPALETALASSSELVQRAAIVAAGSTGCVRLIPAIVGTADSAATPETLLAVAAALAQLGGEQAEPTLICLLGHGSIAVRRAAATALERRGTVAAVEALLLCSEGLLTDSELKRAAASAVNRIRSRLGEVEAGRLSLAEGNPRAGALSIAQDSTVLARGRG